MISTVRKTIQKHSMLQHGDSVLVALSGGADSVCLLTVLLSLKDEYGLTIIAAHVNHLLRGDESDSDEQFVIKLCKSLCIPLRCKKVDVYNLAKEQGLTLEEAGRKARYDFFYELKESLKITKIATAHNCNDNAETVLMRLIRGTGLKGLGGIPYQNENGVIRPLLDIERSEIEAYLALKNISYVTDSSNLEDDYARNKIRHHIVPVSKELNPNFHHSVSSNIELFRECNDFIEQVTGRKFSLLASITQDMISFEITQLKYEHIYIIKNMIYKALLYFEQKNFGNQIVNHIYEKLDSKNSRVSISNHLTAYILYEKLFIVYNNTVPSFFYLAEDLKPQYLETIDQTVCFSVCDELKKTYSKQTVYLDYDKIKGKTLSIRNRKDGDSFYPLGFGHKKKLKNFFIDEKVPSFLRDRIPLLLADDEIVWVCGHRLDDRFKINHNTNVILKVQMIKGKTNE